VAQSHTSTYEKRGTHEGFIRGEIIFVDESVLHFREFVDVELAIERLLYVYQYMSPDQRLVFRYDNTGHHKRLNLTTYPHHKHDGAEETIIPLKAPVLNDVLSEIEAFIELP
jgi:hypothetical protein